MKTKGHHTLENRGNADRIKQPSLSKYKGEDDPHNPFLGEGYYFWDNNIGMAHEWGRIRYPTKGYYIFEGSLSLEDKFLFDLVGNRSDQIRIKELFKFFVAKTGKKDFDLAQFFEVLKFVVKYKPQKNINIFPYKYIRAVDNSKRTLDTIRFNMGKEPYTNLSPVYLICLFELNELALQRFFRIYPS